MPSAHIRKLRGLMEQMEDDSNKHFKAWHKTMRSWYRGERMAFATSGTTVCEYWWSAAEEVMVTQKQDSTHVALDPKF